MRASISCERSTRCRTGNRRRRIRAGGALSGNYAETELEPENPADLQAELRFDAAEFADEPSDELDAPFAAYETIEEAPIEEAPEEGAATDAGEPAYVLPEASDPASLMAELRLRVGMSRVELKRLRREFALKNHPDRLDPSRREIASRRMKTANALIDAALRRACA